MRNGAVIAPFLRLELNQYRLITRADLHHGEVAVRWVIASKNDLITGVVGLRVVGLVVDRG